MSSLEWLASIKETTNHAKGQARFVTVAIHMLVNLTRKCVGSLTGIEGWTRSSSMVYLIIRSSLFGSTMHRFALVELLKHVHILFPTKFQPIPSQFHDYETLYRTPAGSLLILLILIGSSS